MNERWQKGGHLHRRHGPAILYSNGKIEWYIDDYKYYKPSGWMELSDFPKNSQRPAGPQYWYLDQNGRRVSRHQCMHTAPDPSSAPWYKMV